MFLDNVSGEGLILVSFFRASSAILFLFLEFLSRTSNSKTSIPAFDR